MTVRTSSRGWNWKWPFGTRATRRLPSRGLRLEALERRALLAATDMAAITGRVFRDTSGDGFTAGEQIAGATVNLFLDDGDMTFEPGTGDSLQTSDLSDASGNYRFDDLTAGTYFVQQPAQTVGAVTLNANVSAAIVFDATDVMGVAGTNIDTFNTTAQVAEAILPSGSATDESTVAATEALGGERDFSVTLVSATGSVRLESMAFGQPILQYDTSAGVDGMRVVTWDGADGDGDTLDATGLGGIDLTDAGTSNSISLLIGADDPNGLATVRVFTDASNWSQASVAIPDTGGSATSTVILRYSDFIVGGGSGATFTNVGAVQLEIEGTQSVDGQIDTIEALGPTLETSDFDNFEPADLSLTKTVNDATPQVGQNVVFTVTLTNSGPNAAAGITVDDDLPAGVTFVSSTPSQGTYNSTTGVWTVGSLANGASATLQLTASVDTVGAKINTAQVSASNSPDPDSTPGNDAAGEDDQASVTVTPESADLSLTKTVDNDAPQVGSNVTFTVTLTNSGPLAATSVAVADALPAGLSFVSSNPSQGSYNNATGTWTVGTLGSGASATLGITATVVNTGIKTNAAQVSASDQFDPDSTPNNDAGGEDDQDSAAVTPMFVDLSVTKTTSDASPQVNQNLTFTVTLSNAGPDDATNVVLLDPLPAGMTFVSSTPSQGSYNGTTGLWTVGTVNASGSASLQILAQVTQPGTQTNTAQVNSVDQFDVDSTPGNSVANEDDQASVQIVPEVADLSVTKSVDNATPARGSNVTFTVTVTNSGTATATNVALRDTVPAGMTFVSANASQGSYNNATGIWTVGTLANGSAATIQIVASVDAGGRRVNTAQVSASDQFDPDSTPADSQAEQDDQASVTVQPPRRLSKRAFLAR